MIGIVLSIVFALPAAPAADVDGTCDQAPSSCERGPGNEVASAASVASLVRGDQDVDQPRYATPAMIDCRVPVTAALLQALVGECDGTTRDASYRASRDPESERSSGSLRPARRERGSACTLAACAGTPSEGGDAAAGTSPSQPLALFALPDSPRLGASRFTIDATLFPASRRVRPLERPPRA
jgi:hypothetical protein